MEGKRIVAVFDFDGTLTTCDTFVRFIRYVYGAWRCYLGFLLHMPFLLLMKLRLYSNGKTKERIFKYFFHGVSYEWFKAQCQAFANDHKGIIRKDTSDRVSSYAAQNADIYVVSASVDEWVRPFLSHLPVKEVIGTKVEIDHEGHLTGNFATPNCYGAEKVKRLMALEPERSSYELHAYGDSRGDKEILEEADKAIWV